MARERKKDQNGSLFIKCGKVYVRYMERHRDGTDKRTSHCLGTTSDLNSDKKIRRAHENFMLKVDESAEITYWEQLCDDYQQRGLDVRESTRETTYRSVIAKLRRAFEGDRVDWLASAPGRMKMENWLNDALMAKSTRKMLRAVLGQIFHHARRWDMLRGENPSGLIKLRHLSQNTRPRRLRTIVTPEQFTTVMNDPRLPELGRTVWAIINLSGVRGCEVMGLKWSDIEWDGEPKIWVRRSIKGRYVEETKSKDSHRAFPLPEKLARILLRWRSSTTQIGDWIFGSPHPRRAGLPWEKATVFNYIKAAAQRAGFDYYGFGLHNSRHSFRNNMRRTGASLEDQGKAMGHSPKNLEQTLSYGQDGSDYTAQLAPYVEKVAAMLQWDESRPSLICHQSATATNHGVENKGDASQFTGSPIDASVENKGFGVIRGKRKTA